MLNKYGLAGGISLLLAAGSFMLSLRTNIALDALFRAGIVLIVSFASILVFVYVVNKLIVPQQNESLTDRDERDEQVESKPESGRFVDMQTPDDDEEFVPWQTSQKTQE